MNHDQDISVPQPLNGLSGMDTGPRTLLAVIYNGCFQSVWSALCMTAFLFTSLAALYSTTTQVVIALSALLLATTYMYKHGQVRVILSACGLIVCFVDV